MTMVSVERKKVERNYPYIGVNPANSIVLFMSRNTGIIIQSVSRLSGATCSDLMESEFVPATELVVKVG